MPAVGYELEHLPEHGVRKLGWAGQEGDDDGIGVLAEQVEDCAFRAHLDFRAVRRRNHDANGRIAMVAQTGSQP
jgi:hypothetical protein